MPCRQNRGYWREVFERRQDPRGHDYYWLCGYFENTEPEATDTDEWALAKTGTYRSVSDPGGILTNYEQLGQLKELKFEVETASLPPFRPVFGYRDPVKNPTKLTDRVKNFQKLENYFCFSSFLIYICDLYNAVKSDCEKMP